MSLLTASASSAIAYVTEYAVVQGNLYADKMQSRKKLYISHTIESVTSVATSLLSRISTVPPKYDFG